MSSKVNKIKAILARERRKSDRLKLAVKIFYSILPSEGWIGPLDIENIGGGGLRFRGEKKFKKGAVLKIRIELARSNPIFTQAEVVWQKKAPRGKAKEGTSPQIYNTGVRFHRMDYYDRRRYVSYLCEEILNQYLDSEGKIREEKWI